MQLFNDIVSTLFFMSCMEKITDGESGESEKKQLYVNCWDYLCVHLEGLSKLTNYTVMIVCYLFKI
jgi:hypothetical protein